MARHLSTLSILHYVYGGLQLLGGLVVLMVFLTLGGLLGSELMAADDPAAVFVGRFLQVFGVAFAALLLVWGVLVVLSGRWIAQGRHRTGSMVIAALCCISFPFGTALGVFTIIVLSDSEVKNAYPAVR
ncbi:MAG: hypothetical protein RBT71_02930 [Flavobacteriales bacterium]|jgi:hypothetical protein|nr:hypothetical protein [Flavobacteriales bacterium]